jgi:hypothetical protein
MIELASLIEDATLHGHRHVALVFESESGAKNALHMAKTVVLPDLGGRIGAALADERFSVCGRMVRLDFGTQIPFDGRSKAGLAATFNDPLRLVQSGQHVDLLFATYQDAQVALNRAKQMNLCASVL